MHPVLIKRVTDLYGQSRPACADNAISPLPPFLLTAAYPLPISPFVLPRMHPPWLANKADKGLQQRERPRMFLRSSAGSVTDEDESRVRTDAQTVCHTHTRAHLALLGQLNRALDKLIIHTLLHKQARAAFTGLALHRW